MLFCTIWSLLPSAGCLNVKQMDLEIELGGKIQHLQTLQSADLFSKLGERWGGELGKKPKI